MKRGFTLIELLVVVLIVGVLAAVALPQYEKAVFKARFANMRQVAAQYKVAEEAYFMANGSYTNQINNLDISFSGCSFKADTMFCDNYFILDPLAESPGKPAVAVLNLQYCPGKAKSAVNYDACSAAADLKYSVWLSQSDYPDKTECIPKTEKGKMLCGSIF